MTALCLSALCVAGLSVLPPRSAQAAVTSPMISQAAFPLGLDVDSAGNVWIGYADGPMTPKGVTVVPAATGTLFGTAVTAGVESRVFTLDGVQGVLRDPSGNLFVSAGGELYVATATNTTVFGVATTANTLTQLSSNAGGCVICTGHIDGGLAMDSAGNLFGGRKASGGVGVVPVATGTLYGVNVVANTSQVLTAAPDWSGDVAIDSLDNLYAGSWFGAGASEGVYVLPKASGTLYGQSVTQNSMIQLVASPKTAGIDIDSADNIYFSRWAGNQIRVLTPVTRTVLGQSFTANTPAVLTGAPSNQGVAVAADSSSLVTGAGSTRRVVAVPAPAIASVLPASGPTAGGTNVTIIGTALSGATSVTVGGIPATGVAVVNATTVMATTPAGAAGTVDVQITTPGGTATAAGAFTYIPPPPRFPPGPPVDVVVTPTLGGALVAWKPPVDSGTDALSLYAVRSWPGGPVCQVPASVTSCQVRDLDPAIDYYFTVVAMSGAGWGNASSPSNSIRPLAPMAPSAPLDVKAMAGNGSATVSWSPPADPGTSPVLDYQVESTPAGGSCLSVLNSCVITGLQNGTAYTFTVRARNAVGAGLASTPSMAVTPSKPEITITGSRQGRTVMVTGSSTGIDPGTPVELWTRIDGKGAFNRSLAVVTVGPDGRFTWQRTLRMDRRIEVRAIAGDVVSNVLDLKPMRSA